MHTLPKVVISLVNKTHGPKSAVGTHPKELTKMSSYHLAMYLKCFLVSHALPVTRSPRRIQEAIRDAIWEAIREAIRPCLGFACDVV